MSGQIYDRLTQTETLNNLMSTFTGICLLMDEVYDMYAWSQLSTEIVDLLAESEFMSEEVFNKKVSRFFSLESLYRQFPKVDENGNENPAHIFP